MIENKIYIVCPDTGYPYYPQDIKIDLCIFSTYEEAEAYTKKFKENGEFFIYEKILNPPYISNKELSPYSVTFDNNKFEHHEAHLEEFGDYPELALKNEYTIEKRESFNDYTNYRLIQYHFAPSMEEAIVLARKKRDKLLVSGEMGIESKIDKPQD